MANHFPALPAMFVANVQYVIHMIPASGGASSSPMQDVHLVNFGFERVDPVTGAVTFDYSGFDQDTYEVSVRGLLNSVCSQWAASLGVALPVVQAAMTVSRMWTFNGSPGFSMSDQMPYP